MPLDIRYLRHLLAVGMGAIFLDAVLALVWWGVVLAFLTNLADQDAGFARYWADLKQHINVAEWTFSDTDAQQFLDSARPVLVHVPWLLVSALSSVVSYGSMALLISRLTGKTDWLGSLPLLTILSGQNPTMLSLTLADQGVPGAAFSVPLQLFLLALQMVIVYGLGSLGAGWHGRQAPKTDS